MTRRSRKARLAEGQVNRFVRVDDADYDVIRQRARAVQAAGLL